jgi:hypothetical protein
LDEALLSADRELEYFGETLRSAGLE